MPTHSLQLLFIPGNYKKNTKPYGPTAYIAIKSSSTLQYKNVDFDVISPDCVSIKEFRYEVKRLIKELETIDKQADKCFHRDMDKATSMLSKKI